jgi:hypothetical protein
VVELGVYGRVAQPRNGIVLAVSPRKVLKTSCGQLLEQGRPVLLKLGINVLEQSRLSHLEETLFPSDLNRVNGLSGQAQVRYRREIGCACRLDLQVHIDSVLFSQRFFLELFD